MQSASQLRLLLVMVMTSAGWRSRVTSCMPSRVDPAPILPVQSVHGFMPHARAMSAVAEQKPQEQSKKEVRLWDVRLCDDGLA